MASSTRVRGHARSCRRGRPRAPRAAAGAAASGAAYPSNPTPSGPAGHAQAAKESNRQGRGFAGPSRQAYRMGPPSAGEHPCPVHGATCLRQSSGPATDDLEQTRRTAGTPGKLTGPFSGASTAPPLRPRLGWVAWEGR